MSYTNERLPIGSGALWKNDSVRPTRDLRSPEIGGFNALSKKWAKAANMMKIIVKVEDSWEWLLSRDERKQQIWCDWLDEE